MTDAQTVLDRRGSLRILEHQPPQEIEAERATLGCLLLNPEAVPRVTNVLHEHIDVFYSEAHKHIYAACLDLQKVGIPIDEITVTAQLRKEGKLEKVGGASYLSELTLTVPTSSNAEHYAGIVLDAARRRRFIEKTRTLSIAAKEMPPDEHQRFLADLDLGDDYDTPDFEDSDILNAGILPEPIWIRGPGPAQYALIAGEGGTGKSSLVLSIAVMITTGRITLPALKPNATGPVVFLSYEDGREIMKHRLKAIAEVANIPFDVIEEVIRTKRLRFKCNPPGPLFRHEKSGLKTTEFFNSFEKMVRNTKPVLTIIDPLSEAAQVKSENDNAEMSAVTQHLVRLAQNNNTTVILLHHANKAAEGKPMTRNNIRGASSLHTPTRWTAVMYRGTQEGLVVLDVQKNNDYGEFPKIALEHSTGGAFIPSNAKIEEAIAKRATSKVILRGATMIRESEKCFMLRVFVVFPGDTDEIPQTAWFPKSQAAQDGELWRARPWIIGEKEKEIAVELGINGCKIITGEGEIPVAKEPASSPAPAPEKAEDKQEPEETLF